MIRLCLKKSYQRYTCLLYTSEVLTKDLKNELAAQWPEELKERVAFESIELVGVRPECITAYVCEKGILKTSDLFSMICKEEMPC